MVGAPGDDDRGSDSGSAYIFNKSGLFMSKLHAPDAAASADDHFGYSVAISNNTVSVGMPWDSTRGTDSGLCYVFNL